MAKLLLRIPILLFLLFEWHQLTEGDSTFRDPWRPNTFEAPPRPLGPGSLNSPPPGPPRSTWSNPSSGTWGARPPPPQTAGTSGFAPPPTNPAAPVPAGSRPPNWPVPIPGYRPGYYYRPGYRAGYYRPDYRPEYNRPDYRPEYRPQYRPERPSPPRPERPPPPAPERSPPPRPERPPPPAPERSPQPGLDPAPRSYPRQEYGANPSYKLYQCCRSDRRVDPGCYELCSFDNLKKDSLVQAYLRKSCPAHSAAPVLDCASSKVDHRACCHYAGLDRVADGLCMSFCNPSAGLPNLDAKYLPCLDKLETIKQCFRSYMEHFP